MKHVLVTGASGFIGRYLCQRLQQDGIQVRALLRQPGDGPWDDSVIFDLGNQTPDAQAMRGIDTLFHLAGKVHAMAETAEDEQAYQTLNVEATRHLLEAAIDAGIRRLVYFSSIKAMADVTISVMNEDSPCAPTSSYGISKLQAEQVLLARKKDIEVVILRPCMVYGGRQKGNLSLMISLMRRHLVPPLPDYPNERCMVHVEDIVQAAILAATHPAAAGEVYIVSDGQRYSTRDIYDGICRALGRTPPGWQLPAWLLTLTARAGDVMGKLRGRRMRFDSQALQRLTSSAEYSSEKISRQLGFQPRYHLDDFLRELGEGMR